MMSKFSFALLFYSLSTLGLPAQFRDAFEGNFLNIDQTAHNGWAFFSGDGVVEMTFTPNQSVARVSVDARNDNSGVWWALIKRAVSDHLDLNKLAAPEYELRIETRVRTNTAPRRINLHANTNRTTDFHSNLMEYDLPDTNWHRISMTTRGFDAQPSDTVYTQLALMDWGLSQYQLDIDYFKVDVVNLANAKADFGNPIPYHPPIPKTADFQFHFPPDFDASVNVDKPEEPVHLFTNSLSAGLLPLLTVDSSRSTILRWDATRFKGHSPVGSGLLEIKTNTFHTPRQELDEPGQLRVVEILDGNFETDESEFTYANFLGDLSPVEAINGQMIIDYPVNPDFRAPSYFVINEAVMNRLLSGTSKGILLKPLGWMEATFFDRKAGNEFSAVLHFNLKKDATHAEME